MSTKTQMSRQNPEDNDHEIPVVNEESGVNPQESEGVASRTEVEEDFLSEAETLAGKTDSKSEQVMDEESEEESSDAAALMAEVAGMRQQLLRVQADFDNFRRRTRQGKEELQQFATRKLLAELLPVVDNFGRALGALSGDVATDVKTGVEMVQRQLLAVLEQYGVKAMDVVGQPFDPNFHDAVMQEPAEGQAVGIVVQELQKGYELHGKVLRPAMVKVTV